MSCPITVMTDQNLSEWPSPYANVSPPMTMATRLSPVAIGPVNESFWTLTAFSRTWGQTGRFPLFYCLRKVHRCRRPPLGRLLAAAFLRVWRWTWLRLLSCGAVPLMLRERLLAPMDFFAGFGISHDLLVFILFVSDQALFLHPLAGFAVQDRRR